MNTMNTMNNKRNFHKNQQNPKKSPQINENKGRLYNKCYRLSDSKKQLLNKLFELDNKYIHVRPKQETLAKWVGIARETTNKLLASLKKEGFIGSMRRPWTSCKYTISDIFHDTDVRKELKAIFPALGFLSIAMLSSFVIQNSCQSEYVTQYIRENKNYFYKESYKYPKQEEYSYCKTVEIRKSDFRQIDLLSLIKNLQPEKIEPLKKDNVNKAKQSNLLTPVEIIKKLAQEFGDTMIAARKQMITPFLQTPGEALEVWMRAITTIVFQEYTLCGHSGEEAAIEYLNYWQKKINNNELENICRQKFGIPEISVATTEKKLDDRVIDTDSNRLT